MSFQLGTSGEGHCSLESGFIIKQVSQKKSFVINVFLGAGVKALFEHKLPLRHRGAENIKNIVAINAIIDTVQVKSSLVGPKIGSQLKL